MTKRRRGAQALNKRSALNALRRDERRALMRWAVARLRERAVYSEQHVIVMAKRMLAENFNERLD